MAVVVHSETALSTAANTKTAQLVSGTYEFIQRGRITLAARGSATGMNITLVVGGITIVADQPIPYTGTAGALSAKDHLIADQQVAGGRIELFLRNTTGGALTTDLLLWYEPGGR